MCWGTIRGKGALTATPVLMSVSHLVGHLSRHCASLALETELCLKPTPVFVDYLQAQLWLRLRAESSQARALRDSSSFAAISSANTRE